MAIAVKLTFILFSNEQVLLQSKHIRTEYNDNREKSKKK